MLSLIEKVVPGTLELINRRYHLLKLIYELAPIGRRSLAQRLGTTERILRSDINLLKKQSLISTSSVGTNITSVGIETFKKLEVLMESYVDSHEKEEQLADLLNIKSSIIVPGDADITPSVLDDLGHSTAGLLDMVLPTNSSQVIAVMGGTTMSKVSEVMDKELGQNRDLLFIPARGGLGESVEIQANTIAERMAKHTGGESQMLHAPEFVRLETYSLLLEGPEIKQTLDKLRHASLVLYSIGGAFEMASRRKLSTEMIDLLHERNAVGEAFGEFIDENGEVVYKLSRIGIQSEDLASIPMVVSVAGGRHKAQAIQAHMKIAPPHTMLVTDEAAANKILNGGNPLK